MPDNEDDDSYALLQMYHSDKYPGGLISLYENIRTGERHYRFVSNDSLWEAMKQRWEEDNAATNTEERGKQE